MEPVRTIIEHTAVVFGRTPGELLARSRRQPIAEARQAAMWAVRQRYPSISLVDIGAAIGGRHYTTVMHALAAVEIRAAHDPAYASRLQQLPLTHSGLRA
jgi:chromosomal replication initiator protein